MATSCFLCGRPLEPTEWRYRHKLKTGESVSKTYSPVKTQKAYVRYDMHICCKSCHEWIVANERKRLVWAWIAGSAVFIFAFWAVATMLSLAY